MSLFRAPLFATPKIASLSSSSFHSFSQPLVCSACRGSHANIQCTSGVPSSSGYPSTLAFSSFMDDELSAAYKRLNEYRRLCSQLLLEKSSLLRQLSSRRKSRRDAFVQAPISAPTVPTFAPHSKLSLPERPVSPASNPIRPVPIRPPLLSLPRQSERCPLRPRHLVIRPRLSIRVHLLRRSSMVSLLMLSRTQRNCVLRAPQ